MGWAPVDRCDSCLLDRVVCACGPSRCTLQCTLLCARCAPCVVRARACVGCRSPALLSCADEVGADTGLEVRPRVGDRDHHEIRRVRAYPCQNVRSTYSAASGAGQTRTRCYLLWPCGSILSPATQPGLGFGGLQHRLRTAEYLATSLARLPGSLGTAALVLSAATSSASGSTRPSGCTRCSKRCSRCIRCALVPSH